MTHPIPSHPVLIDGSRLIVEACVQAGADIYVGYPITPANLIYSYSSQRFPALLPAPDEISALQWISGLAAAGHMPVTATSFPGFALMLESINMAYMMELPMLIILVQRLGPATGSATAGAQGDVWLLHGMISGGDSPPVFCISSLQDCWQLPPQALRTALEQRTPVVLLTSKEMVMTQCDFDLATLPAIEPLQRNQPVAAPPYASYAVSEDSLAPPFLPVGNSRAQVRLNASTHDAQGILRHTTPPALENTLRLPRKIATGMPALYHLDEQHGADCLVVSYGVSSGAARQAVELLRQQGQAVSLLLCRSLLPIPPSYYEICSRYSRLVFAEENLQGQYARLLFGQALNDKIHLVTGVGKMLRPADILQAVMS